MAMTRYQGKRIERERKTYVVAQDDISSPAAGDLSARSSSNTTGSTVVVQHVDGQLHVSRSRG